jgi:hypothetical protein
LSLRALPIVVIATMLLAQSGEPAGSGQQESSFDPLRDSLSRNEPQTIYAPDRSHPWNRTFHLLFTRTLKAKAIDGDTARAVTAGDLSRLSTGRPVTRIESGDRAIEPFYPSWIWMGSDAFDISPDGKWNSLREPQYSSLLAALREVKLSATEHPPVARALMQADLWAAYDLLYATFRIRPRQSRESIERLELTNRLLLSLADAIAALSLSRAEIAALPDNYAAARPTHGLPDLFNPQSGWMEIRWFSRRSHDSAANLRRATRVFLKPVKPPADDGEFLNRFRNPQGTDLSSELEAVALVIQNLLITRDGTAVPSPITYDVQLRRFEAAGTSSGAVLQLELSRKRLLEAPETGGLQALDDDSPMYLPVAANDLSFAAPPRLDAEPLIVPLRTRCGACHGPKFNHLITFSMIGSPTAPPVVRLDPLRYTHALDVAARKMTLDDFRSVVRR